MGEAGVGTPLIGECERRGQFWANADGANCVWVIPTATAPWESTAGRRRPSGCTSPGPRRVHHRLVRGPQ